MTENLTNLQSDLGASIRVILQAYDQCEDPALRAQLISQAQLLSTQMSRIETALFHQQTVEADEELEEAFTSAKGFTEQIDAMNHELERAAELVALAGKVVHTVTQIVAHLPA
jgi:hypothetical protein